MKKIISIVLCLCLALATAAPVYAATDSTTVQKTVAALGIINGDASGNLDLNRETTRAEFAKMLVAASPYRDSVQAGSNVSPFKDVKYTHWAAAYIKTAVEARWMTGYVDGTFRPDSRITFEEAASAILRLLGYTASDLTGTYPQAQIAKFRALKLDKGLSLQQGRALTRYECMYIFYNLMGAATKSGTPYALTLGYALDAQGEIDYAELIKADLEGPYVLKDTALSALVPFDLSGASVYRNNKAASLGEIAVYDVIYYHKNAKTVWAYSGRAVGTLTAVAPNAVAPSSVTVAGVSYALGTSEAKSKVSAAGEFAVGDMVSLLLGMNGEVVDILPAAKADGTYYGVVTKVELKTFDVSASSSRAEYVLSVACTDGVVREFIVSGSYYGKGDIVALSFNRGELTARKMSDSGLSGVFSADGGSFGSYRLAGDVEILDVSKNGDWKVIYPPRLAGVRLESNQVRFYLLDEKNQISRLILNDVTGDLYSYGILTSVSEVSTPSTGGWTNLLGTYQYIINGVPGATSFSGFYGVSTGGAIFYYDNGKIDRIKNLQAVTLSEVGAAYAAAGNSRFAISENLQVYIRGGDMSYTLSKLSAVNTIDYTLTGYYETIYPAGGQIRVIVAVKK